MKNIENTKIMIERLYIMAKSYKADEVITELFDDLIDQLLEELQILEGDAFFEGLKTKHD